MSLYDSLIAFYKENYSYIVLWLDKDKYDTRDIRSNITCNSKSNILAPRKFGPNGIETGVHKFFWGALQRKPRASAVSLGSLAMGNMV